MYLRVILKVLRCLGFKFDKSIFKNVSLADSNRKYPRISADYESIDHENMFFTGTIAHSLDFRRSSGGFIHGFRYNGTNFNLSIYDFNIIILKYFGSKSPCIVQNSTETISSS